MAIPIPYRLEYAREGIQGNFTGDGQDQITVIYRATYRESHQVDPYEILVGCWNYGGGIKLPLRRQPYEGLTLGNVTNWNYTPLCAMRFTVTPTTNLSIWMIKVDYMAPPVSQTFNYMKEQDPLKRPLIVTIEYLDQLEVIKSAQNIQGYNGPGYVRPENTDGPIVNSAGRRPEEAPIQPTRVPVYSIVRNVESLSTIETYNYQYLKSTNVDEFTFNGATMRKETLAYLGSTSSGVRTELVFTSQQEGEIPRSYYTITSRVVRMDTTRLSIENMGLTFWKTGASPGESGGWTSVLTDKSLGRDASIVEPVPLDLAGQAKLSDEDVVQPPSDNVDVVEFRNLALKNYQSPLFTDP